MNISALIIDITLWGSVAVLGFMAWQRGRVVLVSSMREGSMDFINIVPRIALGVIGSGYIAAVIPPEVITGWLGPDSGWFGVLTAVVAGAATPGGPVVGFSIGAVAMKVGGGPPQVIAYVVAWALFAFQRMILWEIPFMPARFVWFRAASCVPVLGARFGWRYARLRTGCDALDERTILRETAGVDQPPMSWCERGWRR